MRTRWRWPGRSPSTRCRTCLTSYAAPFSRLALLAGIGIPWDLVQAGRAIDAGGLVPHALGAELAPAGRQR